MNWLTRYIPHPYTSEEFHAYLEYFHCLMVHIMFTCSFFMSRRFSYAKQPFSGWKCVTIYKKTVRHIYMQITSCVEDYFLLENEPFMGENMLVFIMKTLSLKIYTSECMSWCMTQMSYVLVMNHYIIYIQFYDKQV